MSTRSRVIIAMVVGFDALLVAAFLVMYMGCTGLWERQLSKIPAGFPLGASEDYLKCVYIGFSDLLDKWRE